MSGIFGVFHLDGKPILRPALEWLGATLEYRGLDGAGSPA